MKVSVNITTQLELEIPDKFKALDKEDWAQKEFELMRDVPEAVKDVLPAEFKDSVVSYVESCDSGYPIYDF